MLYAYFFRLRATSAAPRHNPNKFGFWSRFARALLAQRNRRKKRRRQGRSLLKIWRIRLNLLSMNYAWRLRSHANS